MRVHTNMHKDTFIKEKHHMEIRFTDQNLIPLIPAIRISLEINVYNTTTNT